MANSIFLRPNRSAILPATNAPAMVPISAIATVKPRPLSERWNTALSRVGGTGDHGGVESEDQAAERSDNCASNHEWIHAQHRRHE